MQEKTELVQQVRGGTVMLSIEDGMLQVGSSPGHSFVVTNISVEDERWLRSLLRRGSTASAPSTECGNNHDSGVALTDRRKALLLLLQQHGLLLAPPRQLTFGQLRIRITGLDRVGIPLVRTLWTMGARHLDLRDRRTIDSEVEYLFPAAEKGTSRVETLWKEIRGSKMYLSRQSSPHLTISMENRVIDHGRAGLSLGQDISHLPIIVDDRSIQVGPVFIPSLTCCHLCLDYHQMDRLPGWPVLREAIRIDRAPRPSPALAGAAASLAAQMIDSMLTPVTPAAANPTEDPHWYRGLALRVFEGGVEELRWDPHPRCQCRAEYPV